MKKKKIICIVVAALWVIFSLGYIALDVWSDFKASQMANAYQSGYAQAIVSVADEANKCASTGVPLNVGKDNEGKDVVVTIVGVSCLQQADDTTPTTPAKK